MYCRHCGAVLPDDSKFCNNCGNATTESAQQETWQTPTATGFVDNYDEKKRSLINKAFVWGILGAVFSEMGLLGLIFSKVAKNYVEEFLSLFGGPLKGRMLVARILSKVGFILGLVFTIFWGLYSIILFFLFMGAGV